MFIEAKRGFSQVMLVELLWVGENCAEWIVR